MQKEDKTTTHYSRPVRILALILSILVSGGALTYIIMLLVNLFS